VYRNLLQIKGVSKALSLKICALLGISCNTIYSKLSPHKVDQLNQLLSVYRKKTGPFIVKGKSLELVENLKNDCKDVEELGVFGGSSNYNVENSLYNVELSPSKSVLSSGLLHTPILSNLDEFRKENIKMLINLNTYRGRRFKQGYPVKGQRTRSNAQTARKLNRIQI
jgi:ribosomal protein S13